MRKAIVRLGLLLFGLARLPEDADEEEFVRRTTAEVRSAGELENLALQCLAELLRPVYEQISLEEAAIKVKSGSPSFVREKIRDLAAGHAAHLYLLDEFKTYDIAKFTSQEQLEDRMQVECARIIAIEARRFFGLDKMARDTLRDDLHVAMIRHTIGGTFLTSPIPPPAYAHGIAAHLLCKEARNRIRLRLHEPRLSPDQANIIPAAPETERPLDFISDGLRDRLAAIADMPIRAALPALRDLLTSPQEDSLQKTWEAQSATARQHMEAAGMARDRARARRSTSCFARAVVQLAWADERPGQLISVLVAQQRRDRQAIADVEGVARSAIDTRVSRFEGATLTRENDEWIALRRRYPSL